MSPDRQDADVREHVRADGARSAGPAMIPGAFEVRARRPAASPAAAAPRVTLPVPAAAVRHRSVFERMWRYVMRPTDTPLV